MWMQEPWRARLPSMYFVRLPTVKTKAHVDNPSPNCSESLLTFTIPCYQCYHTFFAGQHFSFPHWAVVGNAPSSLHAPGSWDAHNPEAPVKSDDDSTTRKHPSTFPEILRWTVIPTQNTKDFWLQMN